jgi:hypothetical protein
VCRIDVQRRSATSRLWLIVIVASNGNATQYQLLAEAGKVTKKDNVKKEETKLSSVKRMKVLLYEDSGGSRLALSEDEQKQFDIHPHRSTLERQCSGLRSLFVCGT